MNILNNNGKYSFYNNLTIDNTLKTKNYLFNYDDLGDCWLEDIQNIHNQEALFPCHLMVSDEDMSQDEVQEAIVSGEMKLCRGYVESFIKSCKMPRTRGVLSEAIALAKEQGLSEHSMSLRDFKKHHE